jgi:hypothetical protein
VKAISHFIEVSDIYSHACKLLEQANCSV